MPTTRRGRSTQIVGLRTVTSSVAVAARAIFRRESGDADGHKLAHGRNPLAFVSAHILDAHGDRVKV